MDLLKRHFLLTCALAVLLCLVAMTISVSFGASPVPVRTVWGIIVHHINPEWVKPNWTQGRANIVMDLRLPRALLAGIVGAGLGLAGATMQSVTRNPLADPHLMGVSAGAAFGANFAILFLGNVLGTMTVPLLGFAGAMAATVLVVAVAGLTRSTGHTRLILAGIAISFVIGAGGNVLIMLADPRAISSVVFWTLGGFGLARWDNLLYPGLTLLGCGALFMRCAGQMNALAMGDETAGTLGVLVGRLRMVLLVANALLTGVLVAFSGMIGFVGLMMPHIARHLIGGDNRRVLPLSALLGAIFLVLADVLARHLTAPNDMPIGIVTGLIGGGFFLFLLMRKDPRQGGA